MNLSSKIPSSYDRKTGDSRRLLLATRGHRKSGKVGLVVFLIVFLLIIAALFVVGVLPRLAKHKELKEMHDETVGAVPVVHTVFARPAKHTETITLPGNIGAIFYTTIYARVDGYLKERLVDIGDNVKKGQLLAVIDTPTVDQKLEQAKADLAKAEAALITSQAKYKQAVAQDFSAQASIEKSKTNVDYAKITAQRWQDLATRGAVSLQSRDEKVRSLDAQTAELTASVAQEKATKAEVNAAESEINQAKAEVAANLANVQRLVAEQSFQKVLAPFDGVITYRKVDPGALITQGSMTPSLELYQMAKIDRLRIYVQVPQRVARYLKAGQSAEIDVPEFPERKFIGKITNVSGALDPETRTRQTEIQIDNLDHALLPGMYSEVKLTALREYPWIRVPGTTLVTRTDGQYVVVVDNGKVRYQKIDIGRDYGNEVEVRVGLKGDEQVVVSPSDDLRDGEPVTAAPLQDQNKT